MAEQNAKTSVVLVHSVVVLLLMFGVGFLPPFSTLTPLGMEVLGIFLGLVYGWTFVGFSWPSLLSIIALGWTDFGTVNGMLSMAFGDGQTILLFLVMPFAYFFVSTGMSNQFAKYLLSSRVCIGHPWVMTFFVFLTGWCLGALTGGVASIVITWSFFYGMCREFGYEPGEKYPMYTVLGIGFSCLLGFGSMPFRPVPIVLISSLHNLSDGAHELGFAQFAAVNVPLTLLSILAYLLVMRFAFRPDVSKVLNADPQYFIRMRQELSLTFPQRVAGYGMLLFIVVAFLPSLIPGTAVGSFFKSLGTQGILALFLVILTFWRHEGKPLLDFNKHVKEGCQWDVIMMIASVAPIAAAMKSPKAGVLTMINQSLDPIFSGMGPLTFLIVLALVCWVMTQFVHNQVVATVFMPILYSFSLSQNVNPAAATALLGFAASAAFLTPAASTPAAVTFGNTEWTTMKEAYRASISGSACCVIIMIGLGVPLAIAVFGLHLQ